MYQRLPLRTPVHLGVLVADLDEGQYEVGKVFGVTWTPTLTGSYENRTPDGTLVCSTVSRVHSNPGPFRIELISTLEENSPFATRESYLFHHWGYWSADITAEVADMETRGWTVELTSVIDYHLPREFAFLRRSGDLRVELISDEYRPEYLDRVGEVGPGASW